MSRRVVFVATLLAVLACDDQEPAWRLDRPRVLGAVVSSAADPSRSSFASGEAVSVELVTASAQKARGAFDGFAFTACATDDNVSLARCVGPRLAMVEGKDAADPVFTFTVPPGAQGPLLVFGMVCQGGAAHLRAGELRGDCDGVVGQEVAVRLDVAGPPNKNPMLPFDAVAFDDVPLTGDRGCESPSPFRIPADEREHTLTVSAQNAGAEPDDTLLLSHVATHGKLARLYSTVESSGAGSRFRVKWTAPASISLARETARVHFVLRDGRGGTAFGYRTVCIEKGN